MSLVVHFIGCNQFINFKVMEPSGIYEINSNGFSCHLNEEQSTINGIFEVIERHTVINNWVSERKIYSLNKSQLPRWFKDIVHSLEQLEQEGWIISINFL
ncbi:YcaO-like family protein [Pseudogracilibacillus sp. SO30301A]|uniref:YcaO-like family protein n=1 Tax=Pseudogracilibacillus sp. SO30301A TaxID=3098291 RepID=UPI00300DC450